MARKTPEEAAQTRQHILDAARQLFCRQGVALTTLEQIARNAGVTRGAVYWHFEDKSALIVALRSLLTQIMADHVYPSMLDEHLSDPLIGLELGIKNIFVMLEKSVEMQEILAIWLTQGLLVKELAEANDAVVKCHKEFIANVENVYYRAHEKGGLREGSLPKICAIETDAFVVGLVRNWLLDACQVGVRDCCYQIIESHIKFRRR